MSAEEQKAVVLRVAHEVMTRHDFDLIDVLFAPEAAAKARASFTEFLEAFPDWHEDVVLLVAEGDLVAGRFKCAGTQRGVFMGREPTGRSMSVDEAFIFKFERGRISEMWGLEDTYERLLQLGQLLE